MYAHYEWNTLPLQHCWDYWAFLPSAETQAGLHIATTSIQPDVFYFNVLNINNGPFKVQGRVIPSNEFFIICFNSQHYLFLTVGYLATSL